MANHLKDIVYNTTYNVYVDRYGNIYEQQGHLKLIPGFRNLYGYRCYALKNYITGKVSLIYGHRIVAEEFLGDHTSDQVINHKDRDKENNSADNLEQCSRSYNATYMGASKIGAIKRKENNMSGSKIKVVYIDNDDNVKVYNSIAQFGRAINKTRQYARFLVNNKVSSYGIHYSIGR